MRTAERVLPARVTPIRPVFPLPSTMGSTTCRRRRAPPLRDALTGFTPVWEHLFPVARERILRRLMTAVLQAAVGT